MAAGGPSRSSLARQGLSVLIDSNLVIYAATTRVHELEFLTANTDDFLWIPDPLVSNPVG